MSRPVHQHGTGVEGYAATPTVCPIHTITNFKWLIFVYRHLNQLQLTADGNYHLNKYTKNTDPDDVSLYDGKAYFPRDDEYKEYLKGIPANSKEASYARVVCKYM